MSVHKSDYDRRRIAQHPCIRCSFEVVGETVAFGIYGSDSDVIAQHQLFRMRGQIKLASQIRHAVHPHIVSQQGHGDDERHEPAAVVIDRRAELCLR